MVRSLGRGRGSACIAGHTRSFISTKLRLTDESTDLLTLRHRTIRCVIEEGGREIISPRRSRPRGQGILLLSFCCFLVSFFFFRFLEREGECVGRPVCFYTIHTLCALWISPLLFHLGRLDQNRPIVSRMGEARREG